MYGKSLPRATYPGMVNCHLSPYQTSRASVLDAASLCQPGQQVPFRALHLLSLFYFKSRYSLLIHRTPIHSQKQPASSPKPEIKVFSATVKSVNILVSGMLGYQKLTASLLQKVQVFCLLLCKKGTGLPPAPCQVALSWDRGPPGRVRVSSPSVALVQALAVVHHTSQGAVTGSSAQA